MMINKIRTKLRLGKKPAPSGRITNDTVSEYRRSVLEQGRRFKYPMQYSRHKLVVNATLISIAAVLIAIGAGGWYFYKAESTSEFAYRISSLIPIPVAKVDGVYVRYSDYLLRYRGSVHYLEQKESAQLSSGDSERQMNYLKQQSLSDVVADRYAQKIAQNEKITVTDKEVSDFIVSQRKVGDNGFTERAQNAVIREFYNWSPEEYRQIVRAKLLRRKVAYSLDKKAEQVASAMDNLVKQNPEMKWGQLLKKNSSTLPDVSYGASGLVSRSNQDGGLAEAAAELKNGGVSPVFRSSTDGQSYYAIVRKTRTKGDQLEYESLLVPVTALSKQLEKVLDGSSSGFKTYISVDSKAAKPDAN